MVFSLAGATRRGSDSRGDYFAAAVWVARRWASFWTILRNNSRRSRSNSVEPAEVVLIGAMAVKRPAFAASFDFGASVAPR